MGFWVYMLRCSDGSYYMGHTDNLELRVAQHIAGAIPGCYTCSRAAGAGVRAGVLFARGGACQRTADQGLEPWEEGGADTWRLG